MTAPVITTDRLVLRAWGTRALTDESFVSYIDRNDAASIAVAERPGAQIDETANRPDPEDLVYRHHRESVIQ